MSFTKVYLIITIFIFQVSNVNAEKPIKLIDLIKKNMPKKIETVFFQAKSLKDVEKILGKPDLHEKNTYYYIVNDFKYSLSVKYKKNKVTKVRYRLPKEGDSYVVFSPRLSNIPKKIKNKGTHEEGRYFSIHAPKNGVTLVFKNNSKKSLYSITRIIGNER